MSTASLATRASSTDSNGFYVPARYRELIAIPEERRDEALSVMEKLQRRATKLSVPPFTVTEEGHEDIKEIDDLGITRVRRVYYYRVEGDVPKLSGWTLAAKLEHLEVGNLVKKLPGFEDTDVPERYRSVGPSCEHCGYDRRRKDTYLVVSEDDGWKQVGSSCLKDFTGEDPRDVLALYSYLKQIRSLDDDGGDRMGRAPESWSVLDVLIAAVISVRKYGWVSAKNADETNNSTKAHVKFVLSPSRCPHVQKDLQTFWSLKTDGDVSKAGAIEEWVKSFGERDNLSDYESNLFVAISEGRVTTKTLGIVVSTVVAYDRHIEAEAAKTGDGWVARAKEAGYLGAVPTKGTTKTGKPKTITDRREITLTLRSIRSWEGEYGPTHFHSFTTDEGHLVVWYSSAGVLYLDDRAIQAGDRVVVKATIKAHKEYQGFPQTVVNRVQFVRIAG